MPGGIPSCADKLSDRMRAFAKSNDVPEGRHEAADALDAAAHGYLFADPPTVSVLDFMGVWVRTRHVWCERTGEPFLQSSSGRA